MTATKWYEVFANDDEPPTLLLLRPIDGGFEVVDPCRPDRRLFSCPEYVSARNWLNEDEYYFLVRKELDDD